MGDVVDLKSVKDKIREKTIGTKKQFRTKILEINGIEIEVRQPNIRARGIILGKSRITEMVSSRTAQGESSRTVQGEFRLDEMQVWATIECCFVPGTDERVFTDADHDVLAETEPGGIVDQVWEIVQPWINISTNQTEAKNS